MADGGVATVTSGANRYIVQADGTCTCPDYANRGAPCKHVLAVLIHVKAQALLAPGASPAPQQVAPPTPASAQPTPQGWPPSADRWAVTEAPASCCLRLRVGELELLYTMRDVSDAELTGRVQHLVPWVQDLLDQARERQAQLEALRQQREAAKAAPAVTPPALPPAPATVPADLQALLQQAVQQALAPANGQANGTSQRQGRAKTGDQATGFCSLHHVTMEHRENERGSWYSHWLPEEERHCKGRR